MCYNTWEGHEKSLTKYHPAGTEPAPQHCIHNHKFFWDPTEVGLIPRLRICSTLTAISSWRIPVGRRRGCAGYNRGTESWQPRGPRSLNASETSSANTENYINGPQSGQFSFHDKSHIYFTTEMCICISLELNLHAFCKKHRVFFHLSDLHPCRGDTPQRFS